MAARVGCAILLALAVSSCGSEPPRVRRPDTLSAREPATASTTECDPHGARGPRVCAVARIDLGAGIVHVTMHLDPAALPEGRRSVSLAFERPVEADPPWPALGALPAPLALRYRVALDPSPRAGRSFRRPGGWHLRGESFLPAIVVDGAPVDAPATLRIDAGADPVWTSAGERRVFDAPSLRRLADEAYEIGALSTTRREVAGAALWVATSDPDEASLETVADLVAEALRSLVERLGPPPTEGILVAFHTADAPAFAARLGSTLVQAGPLGAPRDALFGTADLAFRELSHLWSPGAHVVAEDWLELGVADYFTALTTAELTAAPPASLARVVLRIHARYAAAAEGRALRGEPDGGAWARDAGLVVGFCLDAHLRESGSSLGAALRTTFAREQRVLGAEALLEDLAAVSPSSAGYLAALLETEGAFALDECLARHGLEAREVSYEGWSDAALTEALGLGPDVRSFALGQALEVVAPAEGSALEPGDIVTDVQGTRIGDLGELAWAMRDVRAGDRARVVVRRRGEARALDVLVPALEASREERVRVELVAIDPSSALAQTE